MRTQLHLPALDLPWTLDPPEGLGTNKAVETTASKHTRKHEACPARAKKKKKEEEEEEEEF